MFFLIVSTVHSQSPEEDILKRTVRKLANYFGIEVTRVRAKWRGEPINAGLLNELDATETEILRQIEPYTMTSPERVVALIRATRYLVRAGILGGFVECGVWRGGSVMAVALTLLSERDASRDLYLFDTFEGMSDPTEKDRDPAGNSARTLLDRTPSQTDLWCHASLDEVKDNLHFTGYPAENIHFIKGRVEETLPFPDLPRLALVRLDTDWYESTYHELQQLFPALEYGGILLIDDYGHWQGAKEATDRYFDEHPQSAVYLHRVDCTGRLAVKSRFPCPEPADACILGGTDGRHQTALDEHVSQAPPENTTERRITKQ